MLLLSTSGTTGSRKFVRLSHRNIDGNAEAIARYLELTPAERPITSLPLHYTFGLSVVNSHWLAGAAVVVTEESLYWAAFWDAFREHGLDQPRRRAIHGSSPWSGCTSARWTCPASPACSRPVVRSTAA